MVKKKVDSNHASSSGSYNDKPKSKTFNQLKQKLRQNKSEVVVAVKKQKVNNKPSSSSNNGKSSSSIQIPIMEISDETSEDDERNSDTIIDEKNIRLDLTLHCGSKSEYEFVCKTCGGDHDETKCNNMYCPNCLGKHKIDNCSYKAASAPACEWCLKKGHLQSKCPMKQYIISKDDVPASVVCFVCGEKGHLVSYMCRFILGYIYLIFFYIVM